MRLAVAVEGHVDVLQPLLVVALRVVGAEVRAAALGAVDRRDHGRLRAVQHVSQLDRAEQVLVEDRAVVVDRHPFVLLLQALHRLERRLRPLPSRNTATSLSIVGAQLGSRSSDTRRAWPGSRPISSAICRSSSASTAADGGFKHHVACALRRVRAGAAAEHERVEQRVRAQAVAAVDRDAGALARRVQARDLGLAVDVGLHAAHDVVVAGLDVDRLLRDVDAGEVAADVDDLAQRLVDALARHDRDVERDGAVGEAATLVDLGLLGARDDVARGELHLVRRVLLHEALAQRVVEVGALAARALGDQQPVPGERRRVVLDHLHVHQRRAHAVCLRDAVTRADQGVGRGVEALAVAAGREDHGLRAEQLHGAVAHVARDRARAVARLVERQPGREPLLVAVHLVVLHQLLVEHVQDRLAGDVRDVVGAGGRGAAERAGPEQALLVAVEGDADVLEVEQLVGRLPAHDLDRVLVAQVVRPLDGVEGVRFPGVLGVEGRVDPALGGVGVGADGVDLGDDAHRGPRLGRAEGGALAGEAGAYDEDIMLGHGAGFYMTPWRAPKARST